MAKHRWALNFIDSTKPGSRSAVPSPVGYLEESHTSHEEDDTPDTSLIAKQGWTIALSPWKSLPMTLLVMFMAGNQIGVFPIMMIGMMAYRPLQALWSSKDVFQQLKGDQAALQKVAYVGANLVSLGLAGWKLHTMGLLPTAQSDWVELMQAREVMEYSTGGIALQT